MTDFPLLPQKVRKTLTLESLRSKPQMTIEVYYNSDAEDADEAQEPSRNWTHCIIPVYLTGFYTWAMLDVTFAHNANGDELDEVFLHVHSAAEKKIDDALASWNQEYFDLRAYFDGAGNITLKTMLEALATSMRETWCEDALLAANAKAENEEHIRQERGAYYDNQI